MKNCLSFFLFLLYATLQLTAEVPGNYRFQRINTDDGLSKDNVYAVTQDALGFMWFATDFGLNRFDGYEFKQYFHDDHDTTTLANDYVNALLTDSRGNLWVGTNGYLHLYDPEKDNFRRIPLLKRKKEYQGIQLGSILEDKAGTIWVGDYDKGLYRYIVRQNKIIDLTGVVDSLGIGTIVQTSDGSVWVGTDMGRLFRIDPESGDVRKYENPLINKDQLHDDYIWFIQEISGHHSLMVGSERGLFDLDTTTGKFKLHRINGFETGNVAFTCYYSDTTGMEWFGTRGWGLLVVKDGDPVLLERKPNNMMSLSNNEVQDIFRDRSGVYWVATMGGINKLDPALFFFTLYQNDPNDPASLGFNNVSSFCEDESHRIWIGTQGGGVNVFLPDMKVFYPLKKITGPVPPQMDRVIYDLCAAPDGNIWIATRSALDRYDQRRKKFYHYGYLQYNPDFSLTQNTDSYDGKAILSIVSGVDDEIWLGTYGGGIARIRTDKNTGKASFSHFKHDPKNVNSLSNDYIRRIFVDRFGIVWIGTLGSGLDKYDPETGKFTHFSHDDSDPSSISNNFITDIYEDHFGNLWVGTYLGLNKLDREKEVFSTYNQSDGKPYRMISRIFLDRKNNLWITTDNGLYRFNLKTKRVNKYGISNGLQGNNFNINALFEASDGSVYIGGRNGFNVFDPADFRLNRNVPPVVITDILIDNHPVRFGYGADGLLVYDKGTPKKEIFLTYKNKVITFKFAALSYSLNNQYQYAYKMEGLNNNWVYTGSDLRLASFTNLYPGTYTFRVRVANNDGIWNEAGTSAVLHMAVPYWKTWWATLLYITMILGLFYLILRFILVKKKLEDELYTERLERDKIMEINRMKIEFFSSISHEFRTPLTLILSPLESLMKKMSDQEILRKLKLMHTNATRLLNLVNQLLDLRKSETDKWTINAEQADLIEFLEEVKSSFNEMAAKKQVIFQLKIELSRPLIVWFDKMKMKSVFYNLLSNAFKYTPSGKKITIVMRKEQMLPEKKLLLRWKNKGNEEEYVVIDVIDEGIGIPKDKINYIFDRFYTIESRSLTTTSTGIGLTLVKNIVLMHHGKVLVESTPVKGSRFSVYIPLGDVNRNDDHSSQMDEAAKISGEQENHAQEGPGPRDELPSVHREGGEGEQEKPLILVIEDDEDIRHYIIDELSGDYLFREAANGLEGLTIAREELPDLILSDIIMPEMDGNEMVTELRKNMITSHIPVIMLTAKSTEENMVEGLKSGADAYLTKPFNIDVLKARIENLLKSREKLREKYSRELTLKPRNIVIEDRDGELLSRLVDIIEKNMADPDFSVKNLADEVGLSRMQLYRKLKAIVDKTPHEMINDIRLERAAQILVQQQLTVSEVAYMVGYNTPKYFSRCFREKYGMLPTQYMKKHEKDGSGGTAGSE